LKKKLTVTDCSKPVFAATENASVTKFLVITRIAAEFISLTTIYEYLR
jgi:hypothetical protein